MFQDMRASHMMQIFTENHRLQKELRFWGRPSFALSWKMLYFLGYAATKSGRPKTSRRRQNEQRFSGQSRLSEATSMRIQGTFSDYWLLLQEHCNANGKGTASEMGDTMWFPECNSPFWSQRMATQSPKKKVRAEQPSKCWCCLCNKWTVTRCLNTSMFDNCRASSHNSLPYLANNGNSVARGRTMKVLSRGWTVAFAKEERPPQNDIGICWLPRKMPRGASGLYLGSLQVLLLRIDSFTVPELASMT